MDNKMNNMIKEFLENTDIESEEELNEALNKASKDFKATLFIENMETKIIDKDYKVYNIELDVGD